MKLSSSVMRKQNGKNYSIFLPNKWRTDMPKDKYSFHSKNLISKKKYTFPKIFLKVVFLLLFLFFKGKHIWKVTLSKD